MNSLLVSQEYLEIPSYKRQGRAYPANSRCSVPACMRLAKVRGLCRKHYKRWERGSHLIVDGAKIPNLRLLRRRMGLTQETLGRATGLHRNTIGHIEAGFHAHPETVRKLLEIVSHYKRVGVI